MHEIPLTNGKHGHTLNATQIFSPDGKWLVFDTRNDDTHISRTGSICKLNITTKEIIEIYKTKNQSMHGPGVGAAAWNPVNDQIIFIHGLLNCNEEKPYGFTRRFGAIISGNHEAGENAEIGVRQQCYHAEGRNIQEPFTKGALRGGTHAHTWSADGKWISFTYNDYLMECLEKTSSSERKDLRTIGVMTMVENIHEDHEAGENAEIEVSLHAPQIIGIFPGSRGFEVSYTLPLFIETAKILRFSYPHLKFIIARAPTISIEKLIRCGLKDVEKFIKVIDSESIPNANQKLLKAADYLWLCSGTVTLEATLYEKPYFLTYKANPINFMLYKILRIIDMAGLANIIAGKFIIKEFLQKDARIENFLEETLMTLENDKYRDDLIKEFKIVKEKLGDYKSSELVARKLISLASA